MERRKMKSEKIGRIKAAFDEKRVLKKVEKWDSGEDEMRIEFKCQKETTLSVSENGKKVYFVFILLEVY